MRKRRLKSFLIICLMAMSAPLLPPVRSQSSPTPKETAAPEVPCDLQAFVNDPDPQGLNVRTGPGKAFRVLTTIPDGARVRITGARGNWLYVSEARPMAPGSVERRVGGWVYGPMITVATRHRGTGTDSYVRIYFGPRVEGGGNGWVLAPVVVRLCGCRGAWAQALFPVGQGSTSEGWLSPGTFCSDPQMKCE